MKSLCRLCKKSIKFKKPYVVKVSLTVKSQGNVEQHVYGIIEDIPNVTTGLVSTRTPLINMGLLLANSLSSTTQNGKGVVCIINVHDKSVKESIKENTLANFKPLQRQDNVVSFIQENLSKDLGEGQAKNYQSSKYKYFNIRTGKREIEHKKSNGMIATSVMNEGNN